jgi:DNA-binding PadR family transcriptional regulator
MITTNLPLEDVLHEVIRTEPEPHYSALGRWCKLYPHHKKDLQYFFAAWERQDLHDTFLARRAERRLAVEAKRDALEKLRRRGRLVAEPVQALEELDRIVLTAIAELRGGQSTEVIRKVPTIQGVRVLPGAVLASLADLEKRGLAASWQKKDNGVKRFTITLAGARTLGTSDVPLVPAPEEPRRRPEKDDDVIRSSYLDELLWEIGIETRVPTYDALVKWCGRYPQYREKIAEEFVSGAVEAVRRGEPQRLIPLTDEERYSEKFDGIEAEDFALEILERHGIAMPPPRITALEPFERNVLAAVYMLRGSGRLYGINRQVSQATGACVIPAATAACLDRMERFGLVEIRMGEIFEITIGGKVALAKTAN